MRVGLVMECDYREGTTEEEAFEEMFTMVRCAEELGFDAAWLAERHFAAPGRPLDAFGAGIPSIASSPLILAGAIAARTTRLRIGIGVNVLPLCHPIRMAEEAATVDHLSRGRLDFGIGRSGFPKAYEGYGIPYEESRERFQESLEIILRAWQEDAFSYQGHYYNFNNVCVIPKPYQKPHPPIRIAATTRETFPMIGEMGYHLLIGLRGFDVPEVSNQLKVYREAWQKAGHPGQGEVMLRIPVYVAATLEQAYQEPRESTMHSYRRLANTFADSAGKAGARTSEDRAARAQRLGSVTYDDLLRDRLAYGTPTMVAERLNQLRDSLGLSGILIEPNVGGHIPFALVLKSLHLFAHEVLPTLQ